MLIPTQPSPTHPTVKPPESYTAQGLEGGRMAHRFPLGFNGYGDNYNSNIHRPGVSRYSQYLGGVGFQKQLTLSAAAFESYWPLLPALWVTFA